MMQDDDAATNTRRRVIVSRLPSVTWRSWEDVGRVEIEPASEERGIDILLDAELNELVQRVGKRGRIRQARSGRGHTDLDLTIHT